jgi:hypothetical protein
MYDYKFHENPYSVSRVVQFGRTDGETERHDVKKVAFRNFVGAPKTVNRSKFVY